MVLVVYHISTYMISESSISAGFRKRCEGSRPTAREQRSRAVGATMLDQWRYATRVFTAAEISARPALASAKNMPVFGSVYSSLSSPA